MGVKVVPTSYIVVCLIAWWGYGCLLDSFLIGIGILLGSLSGINSCLFGPGEDKFWSFFVSFLAIVSFEWSVNVFYVNVSTDDLFV